jgi:hypothetical protein
MRVRRLIELGQLTRATEPALVELWQRQLELPYLGDATIGMLKLSNGALATNVEAINALVRGGRIDA